MEYQEIMTQETRPLPLENPRFDFLVKQIQRDLSRAVELCQDIKVNRNIGKHHTKLDELEEALTQGLAVVQGEAAKALKGADSDEGDEPSREALKGYVKEIELVGSRLESIAHPPTRHHGHHHHHQRSLFFPIYIPPPQKEREDPHFHDMTLQWISTRDGITRLFAELKDRLAEKDQKQEDGKTLIAVEGEKVKVGERGSEGGE